MKNADYWRGRFSILADAAHREAGACVDDLEKIYRDAERTVQVDLERWYGRFATNNGISLTDARKMLTNGQLEEFRWTVDQYIKIGQQANLSPEWLKKLENASARFHISRLETIQLQIQQQIELLYRRQTDRLDTLLKKVISDGYTHTAYEIQKGVGLGWDITALNQRKLETLLSRPWTADKKTFRDRCWEHKANLVSGVQSTLTQGLLRGDGLQKLTDRIKTQFNVSRYKAGRLAHTETTYFNGVATLEVYKDLGIEKVEILETLDRHTCDICGGLDGTVIPLSQYEPGVTVPPFHPNCRGTTCPYYDDMDGERAARNADGDVYYVPANMNYRDWKATFVNDGGNDGLTMATKGDKIKLTDREQWALNEYISSGSYKINAALRKGLELSAEQQKFVKALDSALQKLPVYEGTVYRSLSSFGIDDLDSFIGQHQAGTVKTFSAYTSAGTGVYDESFPIQYIIQSKTGRDLRKYNPGEMEILFLRETKFRITKVEGHTIYMEET